MTLMIGELVNRTETVPVTFRREALNIRHRLPDRSGQGWFCGPTRPLSAGLLSPGTVRLGSNYYVSVDPGPDKGKSVFGPYWSDTSPRHVKKRAF